MFCYELVFGVIKQEGQNKFKDMEVHFDCGLFLVSSGTIIVRKQRGFCRKEGEWKKRGTKI